MRVVASLSTRAPPYHDRLVSNLAALEGIFDAVLLGLPRRSRAGVPYTAPAGLPAHVQLVWLPEDLGPASKICAGAMHAEDADLVVTLDDDMRYDPGVRRNLEAAARSDPRRVYTFSGTYVGRLGSTALPWFMCMDGAWHNRYFMGDLAAEKNMTTLAGYAGTAYPAALFRQDDVADFVRRAHARDTENLLFRNDDVVLSAFVAKHGLPIVMISILHAGELNKSLDEPVICPSPREILAAVRHPELLPYFEQNHRPRTAPLLFDVGAAAALVLVAALLWDRDNAVGRTTVLLALALVFGIWAVGLFERRAPR
jgi:hypothetical protein